MTKLARPGRGDRAALAGVGLMVLVACINAIDAIIVKLVSPEVNPFFIGFTRALFGLLAVLPWILTRPGILRSNYRMLHVVRAALKLASLIAFFAAFASAPLADATAIAFTTPVFVTIGAWFLFAESPRALRIVAVILGFAGVIMVLRPGQESGIAPGLLFALLGALLAAIIQLILKSMSARDSTQTLVAWNLIITVPLAAIPLAWFWVWPTPGQWALLALQGILGAMNMTFITRAFALAEASLIAPIEFLRLPIVAALAFVMFGQTVPLTSWMGGFVIFLATLLMARTSTGGGRRPS